MPRSNSITPKQKIAIKNKTTVFTNKVINAADYVGNVLKLAEHNAKLGNGKSIIQKGKLKGAPLYYLTLEERATCPTDCMHYYDCYGNSAWMATRFKANSALCTKIKQEVAILSGQYKKFLVRLHILGDFFSPQYVKLWSDLVEKHDELYIFGYTAWHSGPIYEAIRENLLTKMGRVNIRFSVDNWGLDSFDSFDSIPHMFASSEDYSGNSITCPEQLDKTDSCLTCGLCYNNGTNTIKFLNH